MLLDTDVFVALLDKSERNHERCIGFFKEFKGNLFTTEPVLTETIYLLASSVKAQILCIDFIGKGWCNSHPSISGELIPCICPHGKVCRYSNGFC